MSFTLRFVRTYVRPLWRWYLAGIVAVLITNWLSVRVPIEMAAGLDALRVDPKTVGTAALRIGLLGVAIFVVRSLSRIWFFTPGRLAEFALREDLFRKLLRLQPSFYAKFATGDLLSRATGDVTNARAFAGFATLQAINVVAALGMTTWQMTTISPALTVMCVVPIALGLFAVQRGVGSMFALQRQAQAQLGGLSDDLLGALQGVATIQAFDVEDVFVERLRGRAAALRTTNVEMARLRALVFPALTVAAGACVYLLIAVGGPRALRGEISAGQLAAFIALVAYLVTPLRLLGLLYPVLQRTEASLERVFVVLDAVPERPDLPDAVPVPRPGQGPAIELRGLTFGYGDRPVLKDLSVTIPAGSTVGIYGRTGSGKTTLLRLLARLRNPPPGTILVDGADLTRVDLDAWRAQLAMVPQAPFLFSETIRENVGFGAPLEDVREACAAAALTPDLAALPDGLETVVGERGIVLSGGQRQRVALARGLLREAPFVLLDDVLSAVDHATEQELVRMLRARAGATRIIVSHRLSALEHADLVLVLDEGQLVDQGTHGELLSRPGPYRDAYEAQKS